MPSKDMIGRVLSTGSATVTADHVAAFARALGDENPSYVGPAPQGVVAPPTYPLGHRSPHPHHRPAAPPPPPGPRAPAHRPPAIGLAPESP